MYLARLVCTSIVKERRDRKVSSPYSQTTTEKDVHGLYAHHGHSPWRCSFGDPPQTIPSAAKKSGVGHTKRSSPWVCHEHIFPWRTPSRGAGRCCHFGGPSSHQPSKTTCHGIRDIRIWLANVHMASLSSSLARESESSPAWAKHRGQGEGTQVSRPAQCKAVDQQLALSACPPFDSRLRLAASYLLATFSFHVFCLSSELLGAPWLPSYFERYDVRRERHDGAPSYAAGFHPPLRNTPPVPADLRTIARR